jgi:hypothetical protein
MTKSRWEVGEGTTVREKKFFFNKLTYSINIDGVSRCPLYIFVSCEYESL